MTEVAVGGAQQSRIDAAMDYVFAELLGLFGRPFVAKFESGVMVGGEDSGIANMRRAWGQRIVDAKLTPGDLRRGIRGCERMKYAPGWGEFIEACKPAIDVDAALHEAVEQMRRRQHGKDVWSDPAIFWAAAKIGEWDMVQQTHAQLLPRFRAALTQVQQSGSVQPVPERVAMLAAPGASETSRAEGQQQIERIARQAAPLNKSKGGNLMWAERIVRDERERPGSHDLNKLRIAHEALGLPMAGG
ncbi:hypothetical protein WJ79_11500 [Burkholderia ubonensis]|uniref:hypothetical protein n=1 Tax=Burkholderia ubonensis TaxID=101571 RepID=UPI0007577053|nr:hypothetical protein [Burkholderia ubonensis]KVO76954.1 hypothetical protein WJ79_11500 [Burkholderia ubonensis]